MTREQLLAIFTDNGLEAPNKGVISQFMNAINSEKAQEIETAKKAAKDEAEAKYKGFVKPEDHQKIVAELEAEKGKGALAERKAKYQKANLNVDDEDLFNLIDGKLKDSKDLDKDIAEYAKNHPNFLKTQGDSKEKKPEGQVTKVTVGGSDSVKNGEKEQSNTLAGAITSHYSEDK